MHAYQLLSILWWSGRCIKSRDHFYNYTMDNKSAEVLVTSWVSVKHTLGILLQLLSGSIVTIVTCYIYNGLSTWTQINLFFRIRETHVHKISTDLAHFGWISWRFTTFPDQLQLSFWRMGTWIRGNPLGWIPGFIQRTYIFGKWLDKQQKKMQLELFLRIMNP